MDIHQIEYFLALCETLNYTAAAEQCHISRQGLKQAVASIEREYGLTLVSNTRNKLKLTPAGELLRERGREAFDAYRRMDEALRSLPSEHRTLRVGVTLSLIPFYAPEVLDRLTRAPKQLNIEVTAMHADALLKKLDAGELDAAILVDMGCVRQGYRRTVLREDRFGINVPVGHPLSDRTSLTLADLDGQRLMVMSAPEVCFEPLIKALEARGIDTEFIIEPDFYETFRRVRAEGILGMDRLEAEPQEFVSFMPERDLAIEDFAVTLETVLLTKEDDDGAADALGRYMMG